MIKFQIKYQHLPFYRLAEKLAKSNDWQLINACIADCLFRQRHTNRIFKIAHNMELAFSLNAKCQFYMDEELFQTQCNFSNDIFLQIYKVSEEYYLHERPIMNLQRKMFVQQSRAPRISFNESEIINTFTPILEALTQNLIPPLYKITSFNIVVDSQQNVRLINPLLAHNHQVFDLFPSENLFLQMAIVILESCLLLPAQQIFKLMQNQQKLILQLSHKHYSYKLIGLIVILLNQKSNALPINLNQCIKSGFQGPWFQMIGKQIEQLSRSTQKKQKQNKIQESIIRRTTKKHHTRYQDEVQDSQNQTLTKYRNGKRIHINKLFKQEEQSNDTDVGYKSRKERVKTSFNL